jgi:hypothetical protein
MEVRVISPDEFIEKLEALGISLTRRTLLNYERGGLIRPAKRGGGGTGGFWTEYPLNVVDEVYAAWMLLHGQYGDESLRELFGGICPKVPPKVVREIRENIKQMEEEKTAELENLSNNDNATGQDIMDAEIGMIEDKMELLRETLIKDRGPIYANLFVGLLFAWSREKFKSLAKRVDLRIVNHDQI